MPPETLQPNVLGSGSLRTLSPLFWLLLAVTGVSAGIGGGVLMLLLRAVQHLAWPYASGDDFISAVEKASKLRIVLVVAGAGLLSGTLGFILRQETRGGHGGELAERIWFDAGRLDPLRTLVRATLSIVIVAMGASLGREAAPKQIGALAASVLASFARIPDTQRRLLAACGAGAGIAAVYNVPFGGAMFGLEVLLGTISLPLVAPALTASLLATAVSWLFLPNQPTYQIPLYPSSFEQIIWAIVVGPIAGVAAVLYVRLIAAADALRPRRAFAIVAPLVVFAALGMLALPFPQVLGNGKDVVQQAFLGELDLTLLAVLMILRPLATAACLGSGAPGGLFTPTLTLGALLGGLFGSIWLSIRPGLPAGSFAIPGAAAVLAAATQGPVSSVVLVLELTRRLDTLMVPTMLAVAGAVVVARLLEKRSIYSARIHAGRSAGRRAASAKESAARAKESKGFIALSSAARFLEVLKAALHGARTGQPVYVVDREGALLGEIGPDRVRNLAPENFPLEVAAAADFASSVTTILAGENETEIAAKFEAAGGNYLPVVAPRSHVLVGTCRRPRVGPK